MLKVGRQAPYNTPVVCESELCNKRCEDPTISQTHRWMVEGMWRYSIFRLLIVLAVIPRTAMPMVASASSVAEAIPEAPIAKIVAAFSTTVEAVRNFIASHADSQDMSADQV